MRLLRDFELNPMYYYTDNPDISKGSFEREPATMSKGQRMSVLKPFEVFPKRDNLKTGTLLNK